jgi:hypothetical protein
MQDAPQLPRAVPDRDPAYRPPHHRDVPVEVVFLLAGSRIVTMSAVRRVLRGPLGLASVLFVLLPLSLRLVTLDGSPGSWVAALLHFGSLIALLTLLGMLDLAAWFAPVRGGRVRVPFTVIQFAAVGVTLLCESAAGWLVDLPRETPVGQALQFAWLCALLGLLALLVLSLASELPPVPDEPEGMVTNGPEQPSSQPGPWPGTAAEPLYALGTGQDVRIETRQGPVFRPIAFAHYIRSLEGQDGILLRRAVWVFGAGFDRLEREGADLVVVTVDGARHQVGRTRRSAVLAWARQRSSGGSQP